MTRTLSARFSRGIFAVVLGSALLASSLPAQVPDSILNEDPQTLTAPPIPDRLEPVNRAFFAFNDGFYRFVLRPISRGYAAVVPAPARRGVGNFFNNLGYPTRLAGNLLQGRGRGAWIETERFVVNTLAGVGGFIAAADQVPALRTPESDLGQAFATWGIGHGTYLVLPLLGPTSLRDGVGQGLSGVYLSPQQYLPEWEYRAISTGVNVTNESPDVMANYDRLKEAAVDPYVALRDAFSGRRAQQIRATSDRAAP